VQGTHFLYGGKHITQLVRLQPILLRYRIGGAFG